ncbi:GNAT family N-acetyltransferase [Microbacterium sp. ARD32]|uniref:GNAT family N-acetyltransferase n=1 Tax=Microbacterium sp. ARD32 TaxID=2962577 RepID=UPI0028811DF2|nr:GNAT family N-acetyltransferase [Microbacterium sp. ARD32]MDT0157038.1 GNAT family N-acetyltransferase [Microbacterium sp. ARD32]
MTIASDQTTIDLPAGATLRPLVLPARADAGPTPLIREYAAVRNRSLLESTGREDDFLSPESLLPGLRSSAQCERRQWSVHRDGAVIGCAALDILKDGDGDTAIVVVAVLADESGHGIGRAVYEQVEAHARASGVAKLVHWSEHHDRSGTLPTLASPTGFGSVPADRSARFLQQAGFRLEQVERASALTWEPDTDSRLRTLQAEAREHADGYRIVQWGVPTPDEFVDDYAWMKSRMSTDVPDGDLGSPEEIWDAERVRDQDQRTTARGWTSQTTAAQHIATGRLCAYNELAISVLDPAKTHQWDTLVLSEHRGHRLGMLVKVAGLLAWHDAHPDSPAVITYNAEENRPMLSINEAIGFAPIAYEGAWRKDLI